MEEKIQAAEPYKGRCRICEMLGFNVEEYTHDAIDRLLRMKPEEACPKEDFASRMALCDACRHQDDTGVCMMCGCYCTVRGCLKTTHCPMKRW